MPWLYHLSNQPKNHVFPKAQQLLLETGSSNDCFWRLTLFSWSTRSRPHGYSLLELYNSLAQEMTLVAEERAPFTHMWMRINNQQNLSSPSRKQNSATDLSTGNTISKAPARHSYIKQAVYMARKLLKLTDTVKIHKLQSQQIFKEEFQYILSITRTHLVQDTPFAFSGGLCYFMPLPQHCLKCRSTQVLQLIVLIIQIGTDDLQPSCRCWFLLPGNSTSHSVCSHTGKWELWDVKTATDVSFHDEW